MCAAMVFIFVRSGRPYAFRREDVEFFIPFLLFGVMIVGICLVVSERLGALLAVPAAAIIGVVVFVAAGYLWASIAGGFERSAGIAGASLMFSIPSGIGSGVSGWLNRRRLQEI